MTSVFHTVVIFNALWLLSILLSLQTRTFSKYSSFQRAKVIRDKRTNKSKGFGFVSFKDPGDFIKAMKEMDGKTQT